MQTLRVQGIAFSAAALVLTLAALAMPRLSQQTELIVQAALIMVLGVPHGALDTMFAQRLLGIRTLPGWIGFGVLYMLLAVSVVGLWALAPVIFLIGFLAVSLLHFSGDPVASTPLTARWFYGGAVIFLPTLLHGPDVTQLFAFLVGIDAAQLLVPWLQWLGWPWLLGLSVAAGISARSNWVTGLELAAVGLVALLLPPLMAFTIFFCGMHSARHILRAMDYSGMRSARLLIAAALLPMLGVLLFSALAFFWLRNTPLDAQVVQLVFVGLAALTLPHMVLVEQVRLSGWRNGAAETASKNV